MSSILRSLSIFMITNAIYIIASLPLSYAQSVPEQIPSAADPSRIILETPKYEVRQSRKNEEPEKETVTSGNIFIPGADQIIIPLKSVEFSGVTVYSQDDLEQSVSLLTGKNISFQKVIDVANALNQRYRKDGYIAARVFLPEQDITEGSVKVEVSEGKINKVGINNPLHPQSKAIATRLSKIETGKAFNIFEFEKSLLAINDLPGSSLKSILKSTQTKEPGLIDVLLVEEETPESTSVSLDNYGSQYAGPLQLSFGNVEYNVFHDYDQLDVQIVTSAHDNELVFVQTQYSQPSAVIPGLKFRGLLGGGRTEAGDSLDELDIKGKVLQASIGASYTVPLSRRDFMSFGAMFDVKNARSELLDENLYEDRLRVLRLSADYRGPDKMKGTNSIRFELSKGLNVFAASSGRSADLSRADGESTFTKANFQYARLQDLEGNFQLFAQLQGQYSFNPLLASEEFGFGGGTLGRGYDPSEITADSGISSSVELRYGYFPPNSSLELMQPYLFFDTGKVWQRGDGGEGVSAVSAGTGIRFYYKNKFTANFLVAWPLTLSPNNPPDYADQGPRVLFSLLKVF